MTRQDLEKHLKMRRQLMECRDILQNLKRSVGPGTQALTGMPHARGSRIRSATWRQRSPTWSAAWPLCRQKWMTRLVEVRNFIAGVQDDQMKIILSLRYIRGLTWIEVALVLGGETPAAASGRRYGAFSPTNPATAEIETR